MKTIKLENRTIITAATSFDDYKKEQMHNYPNLPAKVLNGYMLRDWRKINESKGME